MIVFSTGLNTPAEFRNKCLDTVASQTVKASHVAVASDEATGGAEHLYRFVHSLAPNEIIVWVDLDDWLPHERVLERVAREYENPNVWLTMGSFRWWPDNPHAPGWTDSLVSPFPADVVETADFRRSNNRSRRATHLKTFRAGLCQQIRQGDFQLFGRWMNTHMDQFTMYPMLEMAGERHSTIAEILYVYNVNGPAKGRELGKDYGASSEKGAQITKLIESAPKYQRLEKCPWIK